MHELPVTQGILEVALEAAHKAGARRITAINLLVGDLTSIVDDSVQFYFDILSRGTIAEGAALRFQRQPAIAACAECGAQVAVSPPLLPFCPICGSPRLTITGGTEFRVESIEVDNEDSCGT
jgi:hydrogenase nickel incorporation protein HypA/HybF